MNTLLLEIGTEEIPAGYIVPALNELSSRLLKRLSDNRIAYDAYHTYGTPRRLAVMVTQVASRQTAVTSTILGPPEKVAFDENKKPLVPAVKFAEKLGIGMDNITIKETDKGRYLAATIVEKGVSSKTILKQFFRKSFYRCPFQRPCGGAAFPFHLPVPYSRLRHYWVMKWLFSTLGNIRSNRYTFGHRFMHPGKIKINSPEDYTAQLKDAYVISEIDHRRNMIRDEITRAAQSIQGRELPDEELLDIVTQLVEYPAVAVGKFDEKFLKLPDEILITSMRGASKIFLPFPEKTTRCCPILSWSTIPRPRIWNWWPRVTNGY